jgi:hypothetical protein
MGFDTNEPPPYIMEQYEIGDMLLLSFRAPDNTHQYIKNYLDIDSDLVFVGVIVETGHNNVGIPCYEIYFPSTGTTSHGVIFYRGIHVQLLYRLGSITE